MMGELGRVPLEVRHDARGSRGLASCQRRSRCPNSFTSRVPLFTRLWDLQSAKATGTLYPYVRWCPVRFLERAVAAMGRTGTQELRA